MEDLAKAEKKRLEKPIDETMESIRKKHKLEVEDIKNDLQRQHRKEIDEITTALKSKHDKEMARMRMELQDMKIKTELAENKLQKVKMALNETEVHHMNAEVGQKYTMKFTGSDKERSVFSNEKAVAGSNGQSSGAIGTRGRGLPTSLKIQNPTADELVPYGNTKISASQAKLYHDNLDFYLNKIHSKPKPGHTVEEMLKWKGNYDMLDRNRYIQWLFPIPESNDGNMYAQQLYEHEAQAIIEDKLALKRVLMAYKMMLDFYGMQLVNSLHGTVKRSSKGWQERYDHLNRSRHNLLRITRILKSLGELGYERLQAPWVEFLIEEAVINEELPNLNGPCLMHWIMAVKDDREREMLYRKANGLPVSQDNVDMDGINSESEDEK